MFFGRMSDYQKEQRKINHTMEFLWQPKYEGVDRESRLTEGALYTHLMPVNYNAPCWLPLSYFFNPSEQPTNRLRFVAEMKEGARAYKDVLECLTAFIDYYETDNVMYSFANDFAFIDAENTYGMMDDIIQVFKERTDRFEFRFSSVSEYY